jgi:KUP system potassium uptake protein
VISQRSQSQHAQVQTRTTVDPVHPSQPRSRRGRELALSLAALGIVYGDIGTSPLYALRQCFYGGTGTPVSPANVLGVLSLIFWALVIVISIKYLLFIMRANNRGEGGILALLSLLDHRRTHTAKHPGLLVLVGIFGAALLYGDSLITPAISVLSAVEGLGVATPELHSYVIPITIAVLVVLFLFQKRGTAEVGAWFGPVMLIWFVCLAVLGVGGILRNPQVLSAVSPVHAASFFMHNGITGYLVLGAVFLVVTGGEALYADMGHFGERPIRRAWFGLALPALLLNYFGQGGLILDDPSKAVHPFYDLVPSWANYGMIALATAATVIASQAVVSGAFSLTRQAVQMGQFPRLTIVQTSSEEIGQIYIPNINWALMLGTITLVLTFRSSINLAAAYGVAVSSTMVITTILAFFVMRSKWHWHPLIAWTILVSFLTVDIAFLGANLYKVLDGGWFPLAIGILVLLLMSTWLQGRRLLSERIAERSLSMDMLIADVSKSALARIPGTGVFLTAATPGAPGALLHHLKLNQTLHERVILLTAITEEVPRVRAARRLELHEMGSGFYRLYVRYGFMQSPNIPVAIRLCHDRSMIENLDINNIAYYVGHATLSPNAERAGMGMWRKRLFVFMSRNALRASDFYHLPPGRSVELGVQIEF